jgi:aminoglycoside 6-adenylyltransferase
LLNYANEDENIRAVLAEGSRAYGVIDEYSDYDIVFVTIDSEPYFDDAILAFLIENFGEIAIMQTPDNGDPRDVYTHLIQFESGVRIDLTFNSVDFLRRAKLESATKVLLDKDGRFENLPPPDDSDFWLKKPSEERFMQHCNEFWWCSPYLAKAVARGQTIYAMEFLNKIIRKEFLVMLAYLAGANQNWEQVNLGKDFNDIHCYLKPVQMHYYDTLMKSYIPAENDIIRISLDVLMVEYYKLAGEVASLLGYSYDHSEPERCMKFIRERY